MTGPVRRPPSRGNGTPPNDDSDRRQTESPSGEHPQWPSETGPPSGARPPRSASEAKSQELQKLQQVATDRLRRLQERVDGVGRDIDAVIGSGSQLASSLDEVSNRAERGVSDGDPDSNERSS